MACNFRLCLVETTITRLAVTTSTPREAVQRAEQDVAGGSWRRSSGDPPP